jgi:endonuclease YncB( thermonuclease family)
MEWFTNLIFKPSTTGTPIIQDRATLEKEFLTKVLYEDVDFFHLNGYECMAKVVKIYDADTVHCIFFINGKAFKFKVRLARIDTAEKDSKDPAEHLWATKAINRLEDLLNNNNLIWLKCHKWDKYGRLLGEIYQYTDNTATKKNPTSINQILLNEGLAYEYHGAERREFRDWAPWEAWLDYPDFRPSWKMEPVDNIGDPEVFEKPTNTDFQTSTNLSQRN